MTRRYTREEWMRATAYVTVIWLLTLIAWIISVNIGGGVCG